MEDKEFTLSKKAARRCGTVNHYAQNTGLTDDEAISKMEPMALPNVSNESLYYIVRWCEQHRNCPAWVEDQWWENVYNDKMRQWEKEFMAEMTSDALYDVYMAASYLDIKCLLDHCAQAFADMVQGKSPEEIREIWGLENDFTPEEEEEIKYENPWKVLFDYQEKLEKEEEAAAEQGSSLALV
ncbi:unnamed protein product, partial [Mesorhabditis belari]|uniref:Skp1-related protein n=1 Tax=Mesorhabditis belari TaxID=2138241 RepID=A0AAF3JAU7_9BILA